MCEPGYIYFCDQTFVQTWFGIESLEIYCNIEQLYRNFIENSKRNISKCRESIERFHVWGYPLHVSISHINKAKKVLKSG